MLGGRRWWRWLFEAALVGATYQAYRLARSLIEGSTAAALAHARDVVSAERTLGLLHEPTVQGWFLGADAAMRFWNVYYGLAHFAVPGIVLVVLWWRAPERYRFWRNVFGWMLALGLVGFLTYPLAPPRLMPEGDVTLVDAAVEYGGWGPIGSAEGEAGGGNRYAAMPSLHMGWSTWAAAAGVPVLRRRWSRSAVALHPLLMLTAIVVTGNHWFLDAPGGWAALALAFGIETFRRRRRRRSSVSAVAVS